MSGEVIVINPGDATEVAEEVEEAEHIPSDAEVAAVVEIAQIQAAEHVAVAEIYHEEAEAASNQEVLETIAEHAAEDESYEAQINARLSGIEQTLALIGGVILAGTGMGNAEEEEEEVIEAAAPVAEEEVPEIKPSSSHPWFKNRTSRE